MVYITMMQSPMYRQMTLEEFLFEDFHDSGALNPNTSNTRTYAADVVPHKYLEKINVESLIAKLTAFNKSVDYLRKEPREKLYYTFHIPKKSGGKWRRIDAPVPELMDALRTLKRMFETDFNALYHTSAFAYIKHRSTLDAVKRHQSNESKWFGKYDLSNFFGSTTLDFVMKQFSMVFPFSEVIKRKDGERELRNALELGFLNGGLPQGTPLSPIVTNIMMIPIDFKLANGFRNLDDQQFVYTRYADDFIVSSKYDFSFRKVESYIVDTLKGFEAPFSLNSAKTRYGSSAGSNWNLGVMLNKDNEITVGYKRKREFQAMLSNYVLDKKNGEPWAVEDVQILEGYRNYYRMIEGDRIDKIVEYIGDKYGVNIVQLIKADLKV